MEKMDFIKMFNDMATKLRASKPSYERENEAYNAYIGAKELLGSDVKISFEVTDKKLKMSFEPK